MSSPILRFFSFDHLQPGTLRETSRMTADLAFAMEAALPDCEEKAEGLRKLLEAKDCFVRAALPVKT